MKYLRPISTKTDKKSTTQVLCRKSQDILLLLQRNDEDPRDLIRATSLPPHCKSVEESHGHPRARRLNSWPGPAFSTIPESSQESEPSQIMPQKIGRSTLQMLAVVVLHMLGSHVQSLVKEIIRHFTSTLVVTSHKINACFLFAPGRISGLHAVSVAPYIHTYRHLIYRHFI